MRSGSALLGRPYPITINGMQRDLAHIDEKVRHLYARDDQHGPEIATIDKRVSDLEKWNKILGVLTVTALGLVGWGIQSVAYLYRLDTRVAMLELTTNNVVVERAMETPRITGTK